MNLAHFGLSRRPFRPTPDTDAYYPAASHETALASLRAAFAAREGLALIDGDTGTGKTLLVLRFLEGLDATVPRVLIPAPRFHRPADLYQAILFDLGIEYRGLTEQELRLSVMEKLLGSLDGGIPSVIVLDEAQHLTADVLEEIRLLGNLETRSSKAAFVVLVSLPALRERLTGREFSSLAQRIAIRSRIEPLTSEESSGYVRHQIKTAGGRPDAIISDEALELLAARCQGIPRLLNHAASLALTLTSAADAAGVDAEAAIEALCQLGLAEPHTDPPTLIPHPARSPKRRQPKRKSA